VPDPVAFAKITDHLDGPLIDVPGVDLDDDGGADRVLAIKDGCAKDRRPHHLFVELPGCHAYAGVVEAGIISVSAGSNALRELRVLDQPCAAGRSLRATWYRFNEYTLRYEVNASKPCKCRADGELECQEDKKQARSAPHSPVSPNPGQCVQRSADEHSENEPFGSHETWVDTEDLDGDGQADAFRYWSENYAHGVNRTCSVMLRRGTCYVEAAGVDRSEDCQLMAVPSAVAGAKDVAVTGGSWRETYFRWNGSSFDEMEYATELALPSAQPCESAPDPDAVLRVGDLDCDGTPDVIDREAGFLGSGHWAWMVRYSRHGCWNLMDMQMVEGPTHRELPKQTRFASGDSVYPGIRSAYVKIVRASDKVDCVCAPVGGKCPSQRSFRTPQRPGQRVSA